MLLFDGRIVAFLTFLAFLIVVAIYLSKQKRFPNWLNAVGLVAAWVLACLGWVIDSRADSHLLNALFGMLAGFFIPLVLMFVGLSSPGEAKFFSAAGAFLGWTGIMIAIPASILLHLLLKVAQIFEAARKAPHEEVERLTDDLPRLDGVAYAFAGSFTALYLLVEAMRSS